MDNREIVSVLNALIETSRDGEQGFRSAARYAKNPDLAVLFDTFAEHCLRGVRELETQVAQLGGKPEDSSSVASSLHRGWMKLKASVSSDDDQALLEECERGEDHAKAQYRNALEKPLPPEIAAILRRQLDGLLEHHDRVKALRDQKRAA